MLWSRSPFGVSAGSSPAPVSRVGRSSASKLRSLEHSFLLRATTAHRASRDDRSRSHTAAVGQHPSLSGAPRGRCPLAPRNAAYRAAGPGGQLGGRLTPPPRANGKPYAGVNPLILWLEAVEKGHRSPTWMTYRQATW